MGDEPSTPYEEADEDINDGEGPVIDGEPKPRKQKIRIVLREGKGSHTFEADGSTYFGDWKENKRSGHGIMTYASGTVYEGDWEEDEKCGQGTVKYANGDKYEGWFDHNKRNGQGSFFYANGNRYEGNWKDDERSGLGTFTWRDGHFFYGVWKNNRQTYADPLADGVVSATDAD